MSTDSDAAITPDTAITCVTNRTLPITQHCTYLMDTSTQAECTEIAQAVGDTVVCSKSGSIAIERFTGPKFAVFISSAAGL